MIKSINFTQTPTTTTTERPEGREAGGKERETHYFHTQRKEKGWPCLAEQGTAGHSWLVMGIKQKPPLELTGVPSSLSQDLWHWQLCNHVQTQRGPVIGGPRT